ncbi:autophagy-related protein 27 [Apodospora peruviana]|uniref:Autophagy-related protein 27 n=1 Tax=Apodospora peruviana TaxID=516989 RepID=A0AAE0HXM1_9PEZI|nr:autophagy-related protein 27 [Apodospora peruviana]
MSKIWSAFEAATFLSLLLVAAAPVPVSANLRCEKLLIEGHSFDLSKLGGPHTVVTEEFQPPEHINTTYTLDICAPLKRKGSVPKGDECPNGTRVCAIKHGWRNDPKESSILSVVSIAGDLLNHGGKAFSYDVKRLSTSESKDDSDKEGVRVTLKGGLYQSREQRAVVEFLCDRNRTGLEGEWDSEDKYEPGQAEEKRRRAEEGGGDGDDKKPPPEDEVGFEERQLKKENAALVWEGYKRSPDGKMDTLFLKWHTQYACETGVEQPSADEESRHWGFFTWIVILVFLATAAYLIFGSWLNYNRYGARGWDLLPHGDTIRDIPYLLKDWTRRVLNTVQSSGSRGGYSAV